MVEENQEIKEEKGIKFSDIDTNKLIEKTYHFFLFLVTGVVLLIALYFGVIFADSHEGDKSILDAVVPLIGTLVGGIMMYLRGIKDSDEK